MPFVDDLNRILRDHEGYTGDGHGGNGALPIGDRSTARKPISKRDLREILLQMAQTMGDPSALQDILDELDGKADLANSGAFFTSRAAMVSAGQSALPGSKALAFHPDGDWLVVRGFGASADDPLFPEPGPRWGILMRVPSDAITAALQSALDGKASQTALDDEAQAREAGDTASRDRANHTGTQPIDTVEGLEDDLEAKQELIEQTEAVANRADGRALVLSREGLSSRPEYDPFSVGNASGLLMGFHAIRQVLDLGFPLAFGDGSAQVTGGDAHYVLSIEDEQGNPVLAVTRGGEVLLPDGGSSAGDPDGFAATRAANELPVSDDAAQIATRQFDGAREIHIGPPFLGLTYESAAPGAGVEVGYMPRIASAGIRLLHDDAYIRSQLGFAGRSGNRLRRSPGVNTIVRCTKIGASVIAEVLAGSVIEDTHNPIRDRSIVFAGQSHYQVGFFQGLPCGILDGLGDLRFRAQGAWVSPPLDWTPHLIQGATGASAVSSLSKPDNCWWMHDTQTDGPALTTFKAKVQDALTAGQPVPEDIFWAQAGAETMPLVTGQITLQQYWDDLNALFAEIRGWLIGLGASNPQVYVSMPGPREDEIGKVRERGYAGVRWTYLRFIDEHPWAHYVPEMYDVPGVYLDLHKSMLGSYTMGYRIARTIANVRGGQNLSLGPQISAVGLENNNRTVRLSISGSSVRMPSNPAAPWIIPAGGVATDAPVPVTRVRVEGTDLVVDTAQDLTGCRVMHPYGATGDYRGDTVIYDLADIHVKMPGLPLRSYVSAPLS